MPSDTLRAFLEELASGRIPEAVPADCECAEELGRIADFLREALRDVDQLSKGEFEFRLGRAGPFAGSIKALQASLVHLTWQAQMVAQGDYSQRVDFMGDFSQAFNGMVERLAETREETLRRVDELAEAAREKETLLRELQHRVKNSLALIVSLVNLQMARGGSEETLEALSGLQGRVYALSSAYDLLSRRNPSSGVLLDVYLERLIDSIATSLGGDERGISVVKDIEAIAVDGKRAVNLGLAATELVTDCFKYAFPAGRRGSVRVSARSSGAMLVLEVSDDGVGLPEDFSVEGSKGLGMVLVATLAKDLGGGFEVVRGSGSLFRVTIPL
jgi:Signal transduction histidine kinase